MQKTTGFAIFVVLSLLLFSCATYPQLPKEKLTIQKIIESSKNKDLLFQDSIDWITQSFKSAKEVIEYQDSDTGKIIGKGIIPVEYRKGTPVNTNFRFVLEIKDQRVRFTVDGPYVEFVSAYGIKRQPIDNEMNFTQRFKPKAEELITSYNYFITKEQKAW